MAEEADPCSGQDFRCGRLPVEADGSNVAAADPARHRTVLAAEVALAGLTVEAQRFEKVSVAVVPCRCRFWSSMQAASARGRGQLQVRPLCVLNRGNWALSGGDWSLILIWVLRILPQIPKRSGWTVKCGTHLSAN